MCQNAPVDVSVPKGFPGFIPEPPYDRDNPPDPAQHVQHMKTCLLTLAVYRLAQ